MNPATWSVTVQVLPQIDPSQPRNRWIVIANHDERIKRMEIFADDDFPNQDVAEMAVLSGLLPKDAQWKLC